jgi:hypothetical protein
MIHPVILKPNIGGNGLLNNLISAWLFDETSGSVAYDAVGSNDGSVNGPTINQTGKVNKCYSFDGTDDYVSFSVPSVIEEDFPNDFSIAFWINVTELLAYKRYLDIDDDNVNLTISANFAGTYIIVRFLSTNVDWKLYFNVELSADTWYHCAITWEASTSTWVLFLNGSNVGLTTSDYPSPSYGNRMVVGARSGISTFSKIKFDQFLIYDAVLTSEQIAAIYNSGSGLLFSNFTT